MTERKVSLQPVDIERIATLCGSNNENLRHLAKRLNVDINHRGHIFQISGPGAQPERAKQIILKLYDETTKSKFISLQDVHINLQESSLDELTDKFTTNQSQRENRNGYNQGQEGAKQSTEKTIIIKTPKQNITPKGRNQRAYIEAMEKNHIQFVVGPAGTGKTFLAVAYAVHLLKQKKIDKICLTRPAVEAGETLGFLPGTLIEKINPYLQPLYDALYSTLGVDSTYDFIKNNLIEISALAYMRGRTLNNCLVILDEGQNSSREQMKMFLTRLGYNSKAVITGDLTQIDLPNKVSCGMIQALDILKNIDGVGISRLNSKDVARHPLVTQIINAYDKNDESEN